MKLHFFSSGPRERVLTALLAAGHEIASVTVTDPAHWPKVAAVVAVAESHGLPVRIVKRADLPALGRELAGEVVLSAGFAYILPPEFLSGPALCLNVHGTLLPKYRGNRTLNWAIEHGDTESGVTVHRIDAGVDTGPILLQRHFPLSPFETGRSLYRKTLEFEPQVVVEAMALLENGSAQFTAQAGEAEQLPDRIPDHSRLDPTLPLIELIDQIRAADPDAYPAHFFLAGEKVCIRLYRPGKSDDDFDLI